MKRLFQVAAATLLIGSAASAEPTKSITPDQVSLGAVRVTDDWLQEHGLSKDQAWRATGTLLAWLHGAERLNDDNLKDALIPLIVMLRNGAADWGEMKKLCTVAPKCIEYMAQGSGFNSNEIENHLRRRDLDAKAAIMKMIAVAGLDYTGKGEWSIVREARRLKSPASDE